MPHMYHTKHVEKHKNVKKKPKNEDEHCIKFSYLSLFLQKLICFCGPMFVISPAFYEMVYIDHDKEV